MIITNLKFLFGFFIICTTNILIIGCGKKPNSVDTVDSIEQKIDQELQTYNKKHLFFLDTTHNVIVDYTHNGLLRRRITMDTNWMPILNNSGHFNFISFKYNKYILLPYDW